MLQLLSCTDAEPRALAPEAVRDALGARPFAWLDLVRPTDEEIAAVAEALGWHPLLEIGRASCRERV